MGFIVTHPVARAVGGVDLVNEKDLAGLEVTAELVLGVHEDQSVLSSGLLAKCKELLGLGVAEIPVLLVHPSITHNGLSIDELIVLVTLGGWCTQVLLKLLVLLKSIGELVATVLTHTLVVVSPHGGARASGNVSTHDELNREGLATASESKVRVHRIGLGVGRVKLVLDDVLSLAEPPEGDKVEHSSLERNLGKRPVEGSQAVRSHEHHVASIVVAVANLTNILGDLSLTILRGKVEVSGVNSVSN
mmetsp:Transcript_13017/g.25266  ORF Transcript_13017/g.25266 Transcript_13017/m.25266 type:complete len:247 (-) Transcript_13017:1962-2702(-)